MYQNVLSRRLIGRLSLPDFLAMAGLIGPAILLIADFLAARSAETYHYSLIRDSISVLAWTPKGWIQTIGFLSIGLLVEMFAAGLLLIIRGGRRFGAGIALLVCFGFGLLLLGAFHTDVPGRATTIDGAIHEAAANTTFCFLPLAALLIAPSLKKDSYWRPLFTYSSSRRFFLSCGFSYTRSGCRQTLAGSACMRGYL